MSIEDLQAVITERDNEIRYLRGVVKSFDPELATFKVTRLPLDDEEEILQQLRTQNWDVALLLKFEDLPK